ncbi:Methylthioribose-1-phosphate isomerase [Rhynchospora pubera]|uniref:Methylthioribose-1-phosphate isomerase n=1 Tax=Rhynchospora pubera TaxID=906938 RepID=A0AAV8D065_9POAL|nr:Methylthioribose-1-phosphate isomerase [Rhynchospora pubera]
MKQKLPEKNNTEDPALEIVKAAAQAWLAHAAHPKSATTESEMRKDTFMRRPSRFQLEVLKLSMQREKEAQSAWNFSHSLWDPYEIVAVSKRLETGLVLEHVPPVPFASRAESGRFTKRGRESTNSFRKLFRKSWSRRVSSG